MREFCAWLEHTAFSEWVLSSPSIWAYPTILYMHSVGMVILAGISAAIDIRLLGVAPRLPIKPMERLYPIMWLGFAISAASGLTLTIADASTKLYNPDFYLKMAFIFAAVWVLYAMRRKVFGDPLLDKGPVSRRAKAMAWISLICWFAAITTGRLLAYLGPVSGGSGATNQ
jgi:hypothetical protein